MSDSNEAKLRTILTIGHLTRPIKEFAEILRTFKIEALVNVRLIPKSASNPQFNIETLPGKLASEGIEYRSMKGLGGLRRSNSDSINLGRKDPSFKAYADYMATEKFEKNLEALIELAEKKRVALTCAEGGSMEVSPNHTQ
jgi:uncharacterized protein (DUF488 family)